MSQLGTPSAAAINNVKGKGRTGMSIVHSLSSQERTIPRAVQKGDWTVGQRRAVQQTVCPRLLGLSFNGGKMEMTWDLS